MLAAISAALLAAPSGFAQDSPAAAVDPAPNRAEGDGPFDRLVIRGGYLIDGTGAPLQGPVDIVVENNRITEVRVVGSPKVPIDPEGRPEPGQREIDAQGMYILPGFINAHAHVSNPGQARFGKAAPAEYAYKLWMGHGVTTARVVGTGVSREWALREKTRSISSAITAPRLSYHMSFPGGMTPDEARIWVRDLARDGADGIKFFGGPPDVMEAAIDEANKRGLKTAMHHAQLAVTRWNVLDSARAGLTSMEHWYGLPEALFEDRRIQHYPADYVYHDEQHRFGEAGRLWRQAAKPYSEKWNAVMEELLSLDFTLDPTFTIYEAARDVMAARTQEWLADYTWPTLERFFRPSRVAHGSFWFDWTTQDEIDWKENYRLWMTFINEYKNRGGRVTVGDDAGFIYKLYGFGYIREFELLQEAGFHPLEVITAATLHGAELLGRDADIGTVEKGKLADLIIVPENPLQNFKTLYGTGAVRLNDETDQVERVGGVRWTIKDGIVYDARGLLQDIRQMVADEHVREAEMTQSSTESE